MDREILITDLYSAFNRREIDEALAFMTQDVSWPRASEGGRVVGKEEIRSYWTRQWAEFSPTVEPIGTTVQDDGRIEVQVHQVVRKLTGELLSDLQVVHVYTLREGLVARMDLDETVRAFASHG